MKYIVDFLPTMSYDVCNVMFINEQKTMAWKWSHYTDVNSLVKQHEVAVECKFLKTDLYIELCIISS